MKKYLLLLGIAIVMGAGCGTAISQTAPSGDQGQGAGSTAQAPAMMQPQSGLKDLPAVDPAVAAKVDAAGWGKTTLKAGVTMTIPDKGAYAPTWTSSLLAKDDARLDAEGCYVTDATAYKRADFAGFTDKACLTTTDFDDASGTRTDYFTYRGGATGGKVLLFTFTKTYGKGFDQAAYTATLEKVVGLIH